MTRSVRRRELSTLACVLVTGLSWISSSAWAQEAAADAEAPAPEAEAPAPAAKVPVPEAPAESDAEAPESAETPTAPDSQPAVPVEAPAVDTPETKTDEDPEVAETSAMPESPPPEASPESAVVEAIDASPAEAPVLAEPAAPMPPPDEATAQPGIEAQPQSTSTDIERDGWYFGVGLGAGGSSLSSQSITGPVAGIFSLRGGVTLANRYLVGLNIRLFGQFNGMKDFEDMLAAWSSILAEGTFFPMAELPFNVAAGLGWGSGFKWYSKADRRGEAEMYNASGNGVSWAVGVGWDFFAGLDWNLSLQARYDGAAVGGGSPALHVGSLNVYFNNY